MVLDLIGADRRVNPAAGFATREVCMLMVAISSPSDECETLCASTLAQSSISRVPRRARFRIRKSQNCETPASHSLIVRQCHRL